jgi:uncharacterized protein
MIMIFNPKTFVFAACLLYAAQSGAIETKSVEDLGRVERSVATLHDAYLQAFLSTSDKAKVRNEQALWVSTLQSCNKKLLCLIRMNHAREQRLLGKSAAMPNAGFFDGAGGDIVLYPIGLEYVAQIRTAEAAAARWTCQASGVAKKAAKHLRFSTGEGALALSMWMNGRQNLEIRASENLSALTKKFCGINGSFAGVFKRDL